MSVLKMILVSLVCLSACNVETPSTNKPSVPQTVSKHTVSRNYCQGERRLKAIWYEGNLDGQEVSIGRHSSEYNVSVRFKDANGELIGRKFSEKNPWIFTFNSKEYPTDDCPVPTTNELVEKVDQAIRLIENKEHETRRFYTQLAKEPNP